MEKFTRTTPRYPFAAPAELFCDGKVGTGATVREISLYGCYLDFSEPYPPGARVSLKISFENSFFEAEATVIYAKPNLGMAVVFQDVKPEFIAVLVKWMSAAMEKNRNGLAL